jgi:hypothetical protein
MTAGCAVAATTTGYKAMTNLNIQCLMPSPKTSLATKSAPEECFFVRDIIQEPAQALSGRSLSEFELLEKIIEEDEDDEYY